MSGGVFGGRYFEGVFARKILRGVMFWGIVWGGCPYHRTRVAVTIWATEVNTHTDAHTRTHRHVHRQTDSF